MMTVFARQADYRFVNMIDRLTSDNYFLGTSSRIPHSGKIRKAWGHVGRESFWFPDGKALAGCCCRSEFSRLAPRHDYIRRFDIGVIGVDYPPNENSI